MNYEKVLDDCLTEMLEEGVEKKQIQFNVTELLHQYPPTVITGRDVDCILKKLLKDGYISEHDKTNGIYWINFIGKMLLKNGGYTQQKKKSNIGKIVQIIHLWLLSIGTFLAGLYALIEMIK